MILCPFNPSLCPVEHLRKAMEDWRSEQIAKGIAKSYATNDYNITCTSCRALKSWVRYADGTEKVI